MNTQKTAQPQASDTCCQRGYADLLKAQQTGFKDSALLAQASAAFAEALEYNDKNPHAYVGLGYLFALADSREHATAFLQRALAIDHLNRDALHLLKYLETEGSPYTLSKHFNDQELLYEGLLQSVYDLFRRMMEQPPPAATCDPAALDSLRQTYQEDQDACQRLMAQMDEAEHEMDVMEPRQKLKPVATRLEQFRKAIQVSEHFAEIGGAIRESRITVVGIHKQLAQPHEPHALERQVEQLMDRCDALADRLDEFDGQGYDIQTLIQQYEQLIAEVENLHDRLDEV